MNNYFKGKNLSNSGTTERGGLVVLVWMGEYQVLCSIHNGQTVGSI